MRERYLVRVDVRPMLSEKYIRCWIAALGHGVAFCEMLCIERIVAVQQRILDGIDDVLDAATEEAPTPMDQSCNQIVAVGWVQTALLTVALH